MKPGNKSITFIAGMIALLSLPLSAALSAGAGERESGRGPLAVAVAAADHELFGEVIRDDRAMPAINVHHNLYWEDSTLMSGVAALYDRLSETGREVPRYMDYLEAWADRDPGGYPFWVFHGDAVCAGQTYIWLYERSGRTSKHLELTDGMIEFIVKGRKPAQRGTGYDDYWMRFWNDDLHMVPPFLARRGRAAGSKGIPNNKDARTIAMEYCRAYADILKDPETGLYWHDKRSIGEYQWGRGNGWVAAGYVKVLDVLKDEPSYEKDAKWLVDQLRQMAKTLKQNRNIVGTWNSDVLDLANYKMPENSGSAFFTYMLAYMINRGHLPEEEYLPVVQKAWHFLDLSVKDSGKVMRVQPVGRGPVKRDFENHSATYGVGGLLLAATQVSRMPRAVIEGASEVECIRLDQQEFTASAGAAEIKLEKLKEKRPDFPGDPAGRVQVVVRGEPLIATSVEEGEIKLEAYQPAPQKDLYLFYKP